jgi:hypothetical protein
MRTLKKIGLKRDQKFCLKKEKRTKSSTMMSMQEKFSGARLNRRCQCELCSEDRRVEEFFKKKHFWWQQHQLPQPPLQQQPQRPQQNL